MNGFQKALKQPNGLLFLPIVFRLAGRLEQIDINEMLEEPATSAYVLRNAQSLFELPVVVNHYQLGIELEAGGATVSRDEEGLPVGCVGSATLGRSTADSLGAIIDTAGRLAIDLRDRAGVLGVLTGPGTLVKLSGAAANEISEMYTSMAKKYSEAKVSGIVLAEAPTIQTDPVLLQETTTELANICRFYGLNSMLLAPDSEVPRSVVDHVFGAGEVFPLDLLKQGSTNDCASWTSRRGLLVTAGEVPAATTPEQLKDWMTAIGGIGPGARR